MLILSFGLIKRFISTLYKLGDIPHIPRYSHHPSIDIHWALFPGCVHISRHSFVQVIPSFFLMPIGFEAFALLNLSFFSRTRGWVEERTIVYLLDHLKYGFFLRSPAATLRPAKSGEDRSDSNYHPSTSESTTAIVCPRLHNHCTINLQEEGDA